MRCRVDDRLLHAEVLFGELAAHLPDQLALATRLGWAETLDLGLVPAPVRAARMPPSQVAQWLEEGSALVLLGTVADLAEALEGGLEPDLVALANRSRRGQARALGATFWVDESERQQLARLCRQGVTVVLQRLPSRPGRLLSAEHLAGGAQAGGPDHPDEDEGGTAVE